jgi:hypothetical protein
MKKILLLLPLLCLLLFQAKGQKTHRKLIKSGHGAATVQELGQAVFSAMQQNQFNSLDNFMPDEVELRVIKRKSSEDMKLVLEKTTADTIKQSLQREFNYITDQTTANMLNWTDWHLADTKATKHDPKNPLLYRIQVKFADQLGVERNLFFEALHIRGRFFLFKQLVFKAEG